MKKPTLEEYEKAKKDFENYCSWARTARIKQGELIDFLAKERSNEVFYLEQAEKQRDVIVAYEVFEQIEKKGKKGTKDNE